MSEEARSRISEHLKMHVNTWAPRLLELSHRLHEEPELAFEEHRSVKKITDVLIDAGFEMTFSVADLPTSFDATFGKGGLHIAFLAEYDALPELGHACGHNIIAASSVGAALALAPFCDELDLTVHVIGTPAEERGGGKQILLDAGVFDAIAVAAMVHPYHQNVVDPRTLAIGELFVEFIGQSAHAAAAPEKGINAADAATISQVAVGLMRQHLERGQLVHGIITDSGKAPNVIPDYASLEYLVRAPDASSLERLMGRLTACFEGAAHATATQLRTQEVPHRYVELRNDSRIIPACESAFSATGRELVRTLEPIGSTDMGNVSAVLPSIHPMIQVGDGSFTLHQSEFAAKSVSESGDAAVLDGAYVLAASVASVASQVPLREQLLREQSARAK